MAMEGLDTRMLTRMLRSDGALRGVMSTIDMDDESLQSKAAASPGMSGLDLATVVTCAKPYSWDETDTTPFALGHRPERGGGGEAIQGGCVRLRHQSGTYSGGSSPSDASSRSSLQGFPPPTSWR